MILHSWDKRNDCEWEESLENVRTSGKTEAALRYGLWFFR